MKQLQSEVGSGSEKSGKEERERTREKVGSGPVA